MRLPRPIAAASILLLTGCGGGDEPASPGNESRNAAGGNVVASVPSAPAPAPAASAWELRTEGDGKALAWRSRSGETGIRFACPAGGTRLVVDVPGFRPVGSEERLSVGGGGDAVALVADARPAAGRGAVSASGPLPPNLAALIRRGVSASYGAQKSGPLPAPPGEMVGAFVSACRGDARPASPPASRSALPIGPCRMQDGETIDGPALRAVGTEPFWGARIEGRCVTYSDPEDPQGTRVWTRFTPAPGGGGTWSGALGGRRFELRARARPGCSDGMSDRRYPLAVDLVLGGERRNGCAAPL